MLYHLKTRMRDALPKGLQVPAKYWYCHTLGHLEHEMRFLKSIVNKNDRVIDVGANRGIYAYRCWRLGARVEVFEPNPLCQGVLASWAAGKTGVHLHPVALSNRQGVASLHIPVDASGLEHDASASLESDNCSSFRDQEVLLRTLDSYNFESVSLIKIDVEGHEYSVIEGAVDTIMLSRPALLVEIEQRHISRPIEGAFEQILGMGYAGYFLEEGSLCSLQSFDAVRHQSPSNFGRRDATYINNFLFLHSDRLADGRYGALLNGVALP